MMDKNVIMKRLELINEYICNECQENLYYPPETNKIIFQKIVNAAQAILNNAARLFHNQKPIIYTDNVELSLEKSEVLLREIFQILQLNEFPEQKEQKIILVLKTYAICPEQILLPNKKFVSKLKPI